MVTLETATATCFTPHVHTSFSLVLPDSRRIEALLVEVQTGFPTAPGACREPFALVFQIRAQHVLSQGCYQIDHPAIGTVELFLVPVGPLGVPSTLHYQAVFN